MQYVNREIKINFNDKLKCLFAPAPYKVLFGGRGGGKTEAIAEASLILGAVSKQPLRIGCFREIQKSIRESMHETLGQCIEKLKLVNSAGKSFYTVKETAIVGDNGTNYFFMGLRHNLNSIKSVHGIDLALIDEANPIRKPAWDTFLPTIRKDAPGGPFGQGSEVWVSFNPELDTDETYVRFVKNKHLLPPGSIVQEVNYYDNKFFPDILRLQMESTKARSYNDYLTVWEGKTRVTLDGAIFAKEIQNAEKEARVCRVNVDKSKPVETFWDLGKRDHTAIWFVQRVGMDFNIIDFYQNTGETMPHYINELQKRGYSYGICHLPHDGTASNVLTDRTAERQLRAAGFRVRVVPRVAKKSISINAARSIFDQCYFDRDKTIEGLHALRRYKYDVDENGQYSREPLHNEDSDAADAFQQIGLSLKTESESKKPKAIISPDENIIEFAKFSSQDQSWMT
jgi:phage terminase large subunit